MLRSLRNHLRVQPGLVRACEDGNCAGYRASQVWTADGEDGKTITLTLTAEADPYVAPHIEVTNTQDMSGYPLAFAYLDGDAAQTLGEWADTLGRMA